MIAGVVAGRDGDAMRVVEQLVQVIGPQRGPLSCSVQDGVAIACWTDGPLTTFSDDLAWVGTLENEAPPPHGGELAGDFGLVARAGTKLRLARGRFAGRPVFWLRADEATVACSEFLPLAALVCETARFNLDHVLAVFDLAIRLRRPLPIVGARTVPANTTVDLDARGFSESAMGQLVLGDELRLGPRELGAAVRDQFAAAVARQCGAARRVAVFGGGGIDSSNVTAVAVLNARRHGTADVLPLAYQTRGDDADRAHLQALARHLDVRPTCVSIAEGAKYGSEDRIVDGSIHSFGLANIVLVLLAEARRAGAQAVLTGDGSELLFDSNASVFGDFLLHHPLRGLLCALAFRGVHETPTRVARRFAAPLVRYFLPPRVVRAGRKIRRWRQAPVPAGQLPWAGPRLRSMLPGPSPHAGRPLVYSQRKRVQQMASSPILMAMREHSSRWEVAGGVPIRFPYCDDAFVRFMGRMPTSAIFMAPRERALLVESMSGLVPDSLRYRRDKGRPEGAFMEAFRAIGGEAAFEELLDMRELEKLGLVDATAFRRSFGAIARDPAGGAETWGQLAGALTAEAYIRWFSDFRRSGSPVRSGAFRAAT